MELIIGNILIELIVNFGSQQIALKNGFVQEGILREEFKNFEGVLEDINYYGLLKSDYEK